MNNNADYSVGERVVTSTLWMGAWRWTARLMGVVSIVILARLLLPEDFGIVATAVVVVSFFDILIDLGTDSYLIRLSDPQREDYDTAWTLRLIVVIAAATAVFLVAVPMAAYFDDNRLADVIRLMALASLLRGFKNIGLLMYRRELKFANIALIGLSQRLVGVSTTIILAFLLHDYWAIVLGELALRVAELCLSYLIHPYRPRFTLKRLAEQWSFSIWIVVRNFAAFLSARGDMLVVAKYFAIDQVGLFSMAGRVAAIPTVQLLAPTQNPVYSGLAKKLGEPEKFARSVLQVIGAKGALVLPAATLFATLSEPLVTAVLGSKWQAAEPLIAPLVFATAVGVLIEPASSALTLLGRVKLLAGLYWLSGISLVGVMLVAAQSADLEQLAFIRAALAVALLVLYYGWACSALAVAWWRLLECTYRPGVASFMMAVVITPIAATAYGPWVKILLATLAGSATYVIALYVLWRAASSPDAGEALLVRKLINLLGRRFSSVRR